MLFHLPFCCYISFLQYLPTKIKQNLPSLYTNEEIKI
jgi:hypothetical protein